MIAFLASLLLPPLATFLWIRRSADWKPSAPGALATQLALAMGLGLGLSTCTYFLWLATPGSQTASSLSLDLAFWATTPST